MDPKIAPSRGRSPNRNLPQDTAVLGLLLDARIVPVENRSCDRKTFGPTAAAEPALPLVGEIDRAQLGYQAFASLLRPASRFPRALPAAVHRSRPAVVPGW